MSNSQTYEDDFSLKKLFVPVTTLKAIHIIVIVGFLVFGNVLFNGFVWDDVAFIIKNSDVHSFNVERILGNSLFNNSIYYRPMPALYFTISYIMFKDLAFFYHFFQIILHAINTVLLFSLFRQFFNKNLALFLSLLFLVHPMQAESVSYISASVSPLFFFFGITAFFLSIKDRLSLKRRMIITGLLLLSLFTKETGILFIFIVFLYRLLFKKRDSTTFFIIGFLIILFYFFIRFTIGGTTTNVTMEMIPIARLTFMERLINMPSIICYYLKTFFFPAQISVNQLWIVTNADFNSFYFPLLSAFIFFLFLGFLGRYIWKKNRKSFQIFLFFLLWFLCGLLLHLQILPLNMTVADRWFYFPMVGLLGVIGVGLQITTRTEKRRRFSITCAIIILLLFSLRTVVRNSNWVDAISLYTHDRKIHTNYDIENNLGIQYGALQQYDVAIMHLEKSIEMFPREPSFYNLGYVYELKGDREKAKKYYTKAIQAKHYLLIKHKHMLTTYIRLGRVLLLSDSPEKAKEFIKTGLLDYPDSGVLWALLAISEYNLQNRDKAVIAAQKARKLFPNRFTNYVYTQILNNQPVALEQYLKR